VPAEKEQSDRIALLRTVDVSLLLKHALPDIHVALHEGRLERASGMITTWEDALGGELQALNRLIDQVRGQTGYIRALAAFSRDQQWRAIGMEHFARGVFSNSRQTMERWKWVPWIYRVCVEKFACDRLQRIKNNERLFVVSGRAKKASRQLRVLQELLASYKSARDKLDYMPTLYAHALERMSDVLDADDAIERRRAGLIAQRDALRERLQMSDVKAEVLKRVSRLPSVSAQVEAYQAVDADRAVDILRQRGEGDARRIDAALGELAVGTLSATGASLLSTLAGQLKPPAGGAEP
jgi:hypothetical protein